MEELNSKNVVCRLMVKDILKMDETKYNSEVSYSKTISKLAGKYKHFPSKSELLKIYHQLNKENSDFYPLKNDLTYALTKKAVRSDSGILNVSISRMLPTLF